MSQSSKVKSKVIIYTDGACSGNPGPGGYGAVLIYKQNDKEHRKELSAGYVRTTNNRMELLAAIAALEVLKRPCHVRLYSDSKYLVDAINQGWLKKWKQNNWYLDVKKKKKAKNSDLWKRLSPLLEYHNIEWNWVKGHAGNPMNERCDELAVAAAAQSNLPVDEGMTDK